MKPQWQDTQRANDEIVHYFHQRAGVKVEDLRKRTPPEQFPAHAEEIRRALRATYLMPEVSGSHEAALLREATVDGIAVELRLMQVLPGVYSTLLVYRPQGAGPFPTLLYLPGHGDPAWDPILQKRCLGFAKLGYLVACVEPFGQTPLTDSPLAYEYHGCGSMAYLLATGQSLLGMIMASHTVELDYLCSRADVDRERVVLMGGSMGGTHTLWLAAIDRRVKAAVAISAYPLAEPRFGLFVHCLCDSTVGLFNAADGETLRALIAPRPLLVIYPAPLEVPLTEDGFLLYSRGRLDFMDQAGKANYALTEEQMAHSYPYAREVYRRLGASDRFVEKAVEGPHGDAQQYRELAYGWFAHFLMGRPTPAPIPEPPLSPLQGEQAKSGLMFWPDGKRPADLLGPTAYTRKRTAALVTRLPSPPANREDARRLADRIGAEVGRLLGAAPVPREAKPLKDGEVRLEDGSTGVKYRMEAEPGAVVHLLAIRPAAEARPNGRLCILLHPDGVPAVADSARRKELTRKGAWVICADLRGMGSTPATCEAYVGLRDRPLCMGALKLGETLAGWWTTDLLALVAAAPKIAGSQVEVTVCGERETGFVALLAAGRCPSIQAVEVNGLLASYSSAGGYGAPYVYGKPDAAGGYGSMVPCIPGILRAADVPQLAALVCPRPLTITDPLWASGEPVSAADLPAAFEWTRRFYEAWGCPEKLTVRHTRSWSES